MSFDSPDNQDISHSAKMYIDFNDFSIRLNEMLGDTGTQEGGN